jgi:hypothetical protein
MSQGHTCLDGEWSTDPSWWEVDGQGIPLVRVCERCRAQKLGQYRPEILRHYDQSDVDEPIDEED